MDRGGERLRGGDRDGGLADFMEAVRLEPARAADVLTAVERRADKEDAGGVVRVVPAGADGVAATAQG